ncbi:hypothetical protein KR093_001191 [Drosophila rubida]|uniref:Uncharacterized protein n=1 Tax=Drosophila rubida TaxID=30044 RepID=A0AAD4KBR7_9MUSC|nr:hypothetical protein KR093_001191 [Drosophila rubida]
MEPAKNGRQQNHEGNSSPPGSQTQQQQQQQQLSKAESISSSDLSSESSSDSSLQQSSTTSSQRKTLTKSKAERHTSRDATPSRAYSSRGPAIKREFVRDIMGQREYGHEPGYERKQPIKSYTRDPMGDSVYGRDPSSKRDAELEQLYPRQYQRDGRMLDVQSPRQRLPDYGLRGRQVEGANYYTEATSPRERFVESVAPSGWYDDAPGTGYATEQRSLLTEAQSPRVCVQDSLSARSRAQDSLIARGCVQSVTSPRIFTQSVVSPRVQEAHSARSYAQDSLAARNGAQDTTLAAANCAKELRATRAQERLATVNGAQEAVATRSCATETLATRSCATETLATSNCARESIATRSCATETLATCYCAKETIDTRSCAKETLATRSCAQETRESSTQPDVICRRAQDREHKQDNEGAVNGNLAVIAPRGEVGQPDGGDLLNLLDGRNLCPFTAATQTELDLNFFMDMWHSMCESAAGMPPMFYDYDEKFKWFIALLVVMLPFLIIMKLMFSLLSLVIPTTGRP